MKSRQYAEIVELFHQKGQQQRSPFGHQYFYGMKWSMYVVIRGNKV